MSEPHYKKYIYHLLDNPKHKHYDTETEYCACMRVNVYLLKTQLPLSGVSQSNTQLSGHLGMIQNVGNLWRIRLAADKQTGIWKIQIVSSQAYTLKVTGQMDEAVVTVTIRCYFWIITYNQIFESIRSP